MQSIGFLLLCGGRSLRMGQNKALLDVRGERMMDAAVRAGECFPVRLFSINDASFPVPPGYIPVRDCFPGCGPMAGIHAAFHACDCDALVVAPCDTPLYASALPAYLIGNLSEDVDAVILDDPALGEQPLLGVYRRSCLPVMERDLAQGYLKMKRFLREIRVRRVPLPVQMDARCAMNLNTPEEYAQFLKQKKDRNPSAL